MITFKKIKLLLVNKVVLYLTTRYITYILLFVTTISIAVKLGPFYYGIWGFIMLLLNYFRNLNFGIPNSINILLVQSKNDKDLEARYVSSAMGLIGILSICIVLIAVYYYLCGGSIFEKYQMGNFFYIVCIIAIFQNVNNLFSMIYRVKNRLLELSIYQSATPVLTFVAVLVVKDNLLLKILLATYLLTNIFSFCFFLIRKQILFNVKLLWKETWKVLAKGFYLFIYNCCFYLMLISIATIVSIFYSVEEYGYYSFAYTLSNSVLLFLEAFNFIIFPKVIDKLYSKNEEEINRTITAIRVNYVSLSHGLMYMAYAVFPLFIYFIPKYQTALMGLNITSLSILLYTNAFGYNSFLMAQNREKLISKISGFALFLNVTVGLLLAWFFHVNYVYVIIGTMIGYFVFAYLCVYYGKRFMNQPTTFIDVMKDCFPISLCVPYFVAIIVSVMQISYLSFVPLLIFIVFNQSTMKEILKTGRRIIVNPNMIDVEN